MISFNVFLKRFDDLVFLGGVSPDEIKKAEEELNLRFSQEYSDFLSTFGTATFKTYELVGICKSERLNVVAVTKKAKSRNNSIPHNLYVVENLNVDNSYIWQDETGIVYESYENGMPEKVAKSLLDYYQYMEQ